jgi:hypothetical protein
MGGDVMADILLDPLQVKNTDGSTVNPATQDTIDEIRSCVASIRAAVGIAADLRVTVLSGTVTTVTTLTGITNIGSNAANIVVPNLQNITAVLTNLNNVEA